MNKELTNALHNTIPFFTRYPPKHSSLTEEDLLTQRPNILYVLKLCNDLKMKEGFQIYQSLAYSLAHSTGLTNEQWKKFNALLVLQAGLLQKK